MARVSEKQRAQESELAGDGGRARRRGPAKEPPPPNPKDFVLTGSVVKDWQTTLKSLGDWLTYRQEHFLGFQANQDMDAYKENLSVFLTMSANNIGDPFADGSYRVESRVAERAVLDYLATLWHGTPHKVNPDGSVDPESCWGYGLSMGATEGNLYALWNARDYLAGKRLNVEPGAPKTRPVSYQTPLEARDNPNAYLPVIFYSEDTHYSFTKAVRVLGLTTFSQLGRDKYPNDCPLGGEWPDEVPSELPPKTGKDDQYSTFGPGSIDVAKLARLVAFFADKGYPILVNLNYGSTFKGAYDHVKHAAEALLPIFERNGLISRKVEYEPGDFDMRRGFWIHVDGALGAGYMPYLAKIDKHRGDPIFDFDFGLRSSTTKHQNVDMVASIALSGHKWLGAPWPCGVYMTKVKYQMQPPSKPDYIGTPDTTFAGSRNGLSPIVLWSRIAQAADADRAKVSQQSQDLADKLVKELNTTVRAKHKDLDLYAERSPLGLTVRFRRPNDAIVAKWSLSTVSMYMKPNQQEMRNYAHVFLMEHTDKHQKMIDDFVQDLCDPHAFDIDEQDAWTQAVAATPFADRGFV